MKPTLHSQQAESPGGRAVAPGLQLRLALFGVFEACIDGLPDGAGRVIALGGRPAGLLTLLALARGRSFSRSELIRDLSSGGAEAASPNSFNTLLWRLRKALEGPPLVPGDVIESDRQGGLRIAPSVRVSSDVEEHRRLIEAPMAKPMEHLTATDIEDLRAAVALYQGDVLASFADDWALRLRERQRRMQLGALARLMHAATLSATWSDAIYFGEAMLELDELREDVHREVMRCQLAAGQRASALRQFERCRTALRRELAIAPMAETLALYRQIAQSPDNAGAIANTASAVVVSALPQAAGTLRQSIGQARWHLAQADVCLQWPLPPE